MNLISSYLDLFMDKSQRLSELVKNIRGERTQRQFAKQIGVSFAAVRSWEEGESYPVLENLGKIASACGMTLEELLAYLKGEIEAGELAPRARIAEDLLPYVNDLPREERKRLMQILIVKD